MNGVNINIDAPKISNDNLSIGSGEFIDSSLLVTVLDDFKTHVQNTPDSFALTFANQSLTFKELDRLSDCVAQTFRQNGIKAKQLVGIFVEDSALSIILALGILKCEAIYAPIDPTLPLNTTQTLIKENNFSALAVKKECGLSIEGSNFKVISFKIEDLLSISNEPNEVPIYSCKLNETAYVMFTSGTTGKPKGVVVRHRELAQSTYVRRQIYPNRNIFLLVSPTFCDSSMAGIWGTLTSGGHIIAASYEECRDPVSLVKLIDNYKVSQLLSLPLLYDMILTSILKVGKEKTCSLKSCIVAGDALHKKTIDLHFEVLGSNAELVNEYGPSESTVWATYKKYTAPEEPSIGIPIPGTSIYILDAKQKPVEKGEAGEIFIGGAQLSKGYLGNERATQASFLPDPFSHIKNARMYKTGDFARWESDGLIYFEGRKDYQVKIRGYRVELEAIENFLSLNKHIKEGVVIPNKDCSSLFALIVPHPGLDVSLVSKDLKEKFPSYMVPTQICTREWLPKTKNGKFDRKALSQLPELNRATHETLQPTSEGLSMDNKSKVTRAWKEVLNLDIVPEDMNLFDLGGHSLMIFKLQKALEKHTGQTIPIVTLFRFTTVASQAEHLDSNDDESINSSREDVA